MLDSKKLLYRYKDKWAGSSVPQQNLHVMNKESAIAIAGEILDG